MRRKFFGTLYNTYGFFALYANVDGFTGKEPEIPVARRPEIDRWIISLLGTLVSDVKAHLEDYDPTPAARMIQDFVGENLSNWYVRLNRKRFWGGGMSEDKLAAYQTLYTCLETVSKLCAPFAPFISDRIFCDLNAVSERHIEQAGQSVQAGQSEQSGKSVQSGRSVQSVQSVHLAGFPEHDPALIDKGLEEMMDLAQRVSSMVLALRRKVNIKVRQPLTKIIIPLLDPQMGKHIEAVGDLIRSEVNVKEIELIENTQGIITKRIKPNFKTLGPKYGKQMKQISALVAGFSQDDIARLEADGEIVMNIDGEQLPAGVEDFEITSEDMPGWLVASEGRLTVALDVTVTEELRREGVARELINRIQNLRKESGLEVTDKIRIQIQDTDLVRDAVKDFESYICTQTLALGLRLAPKAEGTFSVDADIDENIVGIAIEIATH